MSFNQSYYLELLRKNDIEEALKYKNKNIPKRLFKFIYLDDVGKCNCKEICPSLDLNNKKLNAVEKEVLWLSRYDYLNDPFEFKAVHPNIEILKLKNYPLDIVEKFLPECRKRFLIGSLTTNLERSMPMWAHYGNNHKGLCIEFNVKEPKYIFKVSYEDNRKEIANIIAKHIQCMAKYIKGENIGETFEMEISKCNRALLHSF